MQEGFATGEKRAPWPVRRLELKRPLELLRVIGGRRFEVASSEDREARDEGQCEKLIGDTDDEENEDESDQK